MSGNEKGFTLVEIVVFVAIISVTSVTFLHGFSAGSLGVATIDEQETAKNLAESQMEYIKNLAYSTSYIPSSNISGAYTGYSTNISVNALPGRDGNIQKVTVIIRRANKEVTRLENYKVN